MLRFQTYRSDSEWEKSSSGSETTEGLTSQKQLRPKPRKNACKTTSSFKKGQLTNAGSQDKPSDTTTNPKENKG